MWYVPASELAQVESRHSDREPPLRSVACTRAAGGRARHGPLDKLVAPSQDPCRTVDVTATLEGEN
eukprot:7332261-Prorocentrum_lima.AAC.1